VQRFPLTIRALVWLRVETRARSSGTREALQPLFAPSAVCDQTPEVHMVRRITAMSQPSAVHPPRPRPIGWATGTQDLSVG